MSTSKTGKHGHAKVHLVALDIFTGEEPIWKKLEEVKFSCPGKKLEDICPSTHNMEVLMYIFVNCAITQKY